MDDDPLMPLLIEAITRLCRLNGKWPIKWVIGDKWVIQHGFDEWTIGPDESATTAQVREVFVQSSGVYELQDC